MCMNSGSISSELHMVSHNNKYIYQKTQEKQFGHIFFINYQNKLDFHRQHA